eukprot:1488320-Prymnesium_polylepis.1
MSNFLLALRESPPVPKSRSSAPSRFVCRYGVCPMPMVRHKAVLKRYAALWCLWHEIPCG